MKRTLTCTFLGISVALILYVAFTFTKAYKIWNFERHITSLVRMLDLIDNHDTLGYVLKPGLLPADSACFIYPDKSKITPVYSDAFGNRVPETDSTQNFLRSFLFLGCSFTFGFFAGADSTYPYLTSRLLNARCLNASMGGYGYSQMLLKAKQAIEQYKPEVVFVQNSDWLLERSQSIHNITIQPLQVSNPFFYENEKGIQISPPLYSNQDLFALLQCLPKYRNGWFSYFVSLGAINWLYIKTDFTNARIYVLQKLGLMPVPTANKEAILKYTFNEFTKICRENNCRLVVVGVGKNQHPLPGSFAFVDAEEHLKNYAAANNRGYDTLYHNWTLDYREDFDDHPNHFAHRKIAEAIVQHFGAN